MLVIMTLKMAEKLESEPSKFSKGQSDENGDGELKSFFLLKMYYTEQSLIKPKKQLGMLY